MLPISVVLTYYENHRTLAASLASFCQQSLALPDYEIIVVDDASSHPAQDFVGRDLPANCQLLTLAQNGGQAAATNRGVERAQGEVVLLSCTDILASPDLLHHHLSAHRQHGRLGVLGAIPYAAAVPMTPFMRYLDRSGVQFNFAAIHDAEAVPPQMVYAPNFSLRKRDFHDVGGFNERLTYGYQDVDLGLRLHGHGVRIVYRPAAIGYHDHPTSVRAYLGRQRRVGQLALTMLELHPGIESPERLRAQICRVAPQLAQREELLCSVEAMEARIAALGEVPSSLQEKLHPLYAALLNIGMVEGILTDPARLQSLLHLNLSDDGRVA